MKMVMKMEWTKESQLGNRMAMQWGYMKDLRLDEMLELKLESHLDQLLDMEMERILVLRWVVP